MIKIAVDCMGGDHGLAATIPACVEFVRQNATCHLLLVGDRRKIEHALGIPGAERTSAAISIVREVASETRVAGVNGHPQLSIVHASEVVGMDEAPALALRGKKDSSMRVCLDQMKIGAADACVSSGNTGALMATARYVLKTLEGIDRPAIASQLPNIKGSTIMLDLGANVDSSAEHLLQFAYMGAALAQCLDDKPTPTIGLLNIGEELIKGNEVVKQASQLLQASGLHFYGNVEGDDIYKGTTDVVVCDGFVGNVALKTSEGLAQMMAHFIREEFSRGPLSKLMAVLSYPVLKRFKRRVDHRRYNGASLIGLRGVVVKSHGSADALAFGYALKRAFDAVEHRLVEKLAEGLAQSRL